MMHVTTSKILLKLIIFIFNNLKEVRYAVPAHSITKKAMGGGNIRGYYPRGVIVW